MKKEKEVGKCMNTNMSKYIEIMSDIVKDLPKNIESVEFGFRYFEDDEMPSTRVFCVKIKGLPNEGGYNYGVALPTSIADVDEITLSVLINECRNELIRKMGMK